MDVRQYFPLAVCTACAGIVAPTPAVATYLRDADHAVCECSIPAPRALNEEEDCT